MVTGKTFRVETLADMAAIPANRIDAFLVDLGNVLRSRAAIADLLGCVSEEQHRAMLAYVIWIDDGDHSIKVHLEEAE